MWGKSRVLPWVETGLRQQPRIGSSSTNWDWTLPRYAGVTSAGRFSITADQCVLWINWLVALLSSTKEEKTTKARVPDLDVSFLAMNTLRLMSKDKFAVSDHIQRTFLDRIKNLFGELPDTTPTAQAFCHPHFSFLIDFAAAINKRTPVGVLMATFSTEGFCSAEDEKVRSLWRAGCALSLSYTGLGTISWFDKAVLCVQKPAIDFLKSISVECFWTFIGYYISPTERMDYTWIFCRLMDDTALSFLSANAMPRETAFFVALAGPQLDIDDEIWAIASLRKLSRNDVATGFAMALGYTENRMTTSWSSGVFPENYAFQDQLSKKDIQNYRDAINKMAQSQRKAAQHEEALPKINPAPEATPTGGLGDM